jgi:hypothetical protein
VVSVVISGKRTVNDLRAERADRVRDPMSNRRLVQRDRTIGKGHEAVIEPEKASDTLGLALSDGRVQRDEERKHLTAKTLVERKVTADGYDLVVGMGGHD